MTSLRRAVLCLALFGAASACAPREVILEGERLDIRTGLPAEVSVTAGAGPVPFRAPPVVANANWTQRAGGPEHAAPHAALTTSLRQVWSADIGDGNSRKYRMTGDPVVAGGRVFAMDSRARVTAVTTAGGRLWSVDLTPPSDNDDDASGGGVAVAGGTVFATTGFGRLHALEAASGAEVWSQRFDGALAGPPTVRDGLVYVVTRDSGTFAVNVETGRVVWSLDGLPSEAGFDGGAAPAVDDRIAVLPLSSGELIGAFRQGGVRRWSASLLGERTGIVFSRIREISGDPVIVDGTVYVGTLGGRTVALDVQTGERLWTADTGALSPPFVAGNSVFLMSDLNQLVRLSASSGEEIWNVELPFFSARRARRNKDVFAFYGPILAGGRLIVGSSEGALLSYNPETGAVLGETEMNGAAASNPVVAGGTLYILNDRGQLLAFR